MEIIYYQIYKEKLPEYLEGYTGYIPTIQKEYICKPNNS